MFNYCIGLYLTFVNKPDLDIQFSAHCYITTHMQDVTNNSYFKGDHHAEKLSVTLLGLYNT